MSNEFITNHVVSIINVMIQCDLIDLNNFESAVQVVAEQVNKVNNQEYISSEQDEK